MCFGFNYDIDNTLNENSILFEKVIASESYGELNSQFDFELNEDKQLNLIFCDNFFACTEKLKKNYQVTFLIHRSNSNFIFF